MTNVLRAAAAACLALTALAACSRESGTGPAASGPAGFPSLNAAYSATYQMYEDGAEQPVMEGSMYRDGAQRMRFDMVRNGQPVAMVFDAANRRSLMFRTGEGAPRAALVMPHGEDSVFENMSDWDSWSDGETVQPQKVGTDTVAGERCDVWRAPAGEGEATGSEACVTSDGILLRAGDTGAATPDLIATNVDRGRPDAALFSIPEGYEIIDYAPCMSMAQDAMAAARSGERPDMSRMRECETIGRRAAEIMGGMN